MIKGRQEDLSNRVYCLSCCPFGIKNIRDFVDPLNEETEVEIDFRGTFKRALVIAMGNKCAICGYKATIQALCIHHIDPSKKTFSFGSYNVLNFEKYNLEMKNCLLLCLNCHSEIHSKHIPEEKVLEVYKPELYKTLVAKKRLLKKVYPIVDCKVCNKQYQPSTGNQKYCSNECQSIGKKKFDITKIKLELLIREKHPVEIGKLFNVSEASVRKRCEKYGISYKKKYMKVRN